MQQDRPLWSVNELRNKFFEFFASKNHQIVDASSLILKDDPSLMFVNAGMNQFKNYFLGNDKASFPRLANSQKCLRVSGKHNDLEEVGVDTYHHTLFEMLGNWSFGDYFKQEAIDYAWEFLTQELKVNPEQLYVSVFAGDKTDGLPLDTEAKEIWSKYLPADRILAFDKKDNFWEMGAVGPCGPCSEIHVDMRSPQEREKTPGASLVNMDHPDVIEIWNLVFIQYQRVNDGSLKNLPEKHVDTGMGLERLARLIQGKNSNYDIDLFQHLIAVLEEKAGQQYGKNEQKDIAFRVMADHIRAVCFVISDGQMPDNNGAGYVIRRILRRAIRYYYSSLDRDQPLLFELVKPLAKLMGEAYPALKSQQDLCYKVVLEEEKQFLRTLSKGIQLFNQKSETLRGELGGDIAFQLYDTFGFPIDLTNLLASEKGLKVNLQAFEQLLLAQKNRSKNADNQEVGDWVELIKTGKSTFCGYDVLSSTSKILAYRTMQLKGKTLYQVEFETTPFYARGGGQVGDKGVLVFEGKTYAIIDTFKENNRHISLMEHLPQKLDQSYLLSVDVAFRNQVKKNHTATHLLHLVLRNVLGNHVEQKGSLVDNQRLRFDFSHFERIDQDTLHTIEHEVNQLILQGILLNETRETTIEKATKMGAMALFGEKYGDKVRVIQFGDSLELCGGTHVNNTSELGFFKIISESSISAGIRRIEAITGEAAFEHIQNTYTENLEIAKALNHPKNLVQQVETMVQEAISIKKNLEELYKEKENQYQRQLIGQMKETKGLKLIASELNLPTENIKNLAFNLLRLYDNLVLLLANTSDNKIQITLGLSKVLVAEKKLKANEMIKSLSPIIKGGGGGQDYYATAGGQNAKAFPMVLEKLESMLN